ncbi:hypothetical protein QBC38DRAFT_505231, partial [Podospora fimiseda]
MEGGRSIPDKGNRNTKTKSQGRSPFYIEQHSQPGVDVQESGPVGRSPEAGGAAWPTWRRRFGIRAGPVGRSREAVCAGDGDSQDEARGRSPFHADQHGQPGVDVLESGPVGRSREAVCAGDGDSQDEARGRSV